MFDRRQFIASAASLSTLALPVRASAEAGDPITKLLDDAVQRALQDSPQLLTLTGLDAGNNAAARGKLDDRSPGGVGRMRAIFADLAAGLARHDPAKLQGSDWINHQSAAYLAATTLESFSFPFGDPNVGVATPYIVSQLSGSYRSIPSFLATQHRVDSRADAEAYLSRLFAFAKVLDQETERARADFERGVIPPDFVLRTTSAQLAALTFPDPSRSELATGLSARATAKGIEGTWNAGAAAIVGRDVYPALRRQAALLSGALPRAGDDAGVWRLPRGEDYYRYAIRAATTTDMVPAEIHRLGLELVAELTARADTILRASGLTSGSVATRIASLRRDPAQLYSNDEAGRAMLLADLGRTVEHVQTQLPAWFGQLPKAKLDIVRMPPSIEAGAPGATYQTPSLDGNRPGLFSINLRDLAEWPRLDLPTLVFHEGIPGHHLQNALMIEAADLPMLRRMPIFSGYSEGWALYAEQLADEMGAYADAPLARLGYIASMLFRATRLVVDSGIHHMRWSRAQAIRYMVDTLGDAESTVTREVERYCVQPGQASSYMLGWRVWTAARERAKARLGTRFDIRTFHDRGLLAGSMPLDVLARVIDDWK
ncbi:DUF885 domain-containing protein [Allosphingosinicella deserti]|nr:DUF885 family protein [Sphingomonas deserti]